MRLATLTRSAIALVLITLGSAAICPAFEGTDSTFTASDGVKIHYIEAGTGSPVVLIHGYTGTAQGNWFSNGVAEALAKNHRVVAIDCRGHGKSEKPHDPMKYGKQMVKDVVELMDHLKIPKAHIHGYSMGGFIVSQLLVMAPDRFITASFGGSGVPEVEERYKAEVPKDEPGGDHDPQEKEASGKLQAHPDRDPEALAAVRQAWDPRDRGAIDLAKITIPVLAINGEFDMPVAKTHRMQRELKNFKGVILPGKSHLTAIMAGYIPQLYIDSLVEFINSNDSGK